METSELNSEIVDLKENVRKINEELNIWALLDEKMVPYIYEKSLHKIIHHLEDIKYSSRIKSYTKTIKPKNDIPLPLNQKRYDNVTWRKNRILLCTTSLKNSKEFYHGAKRASIDTQPILYYYSITYLFSFLINSFLIFDNAVKHHGIYVYSANEIYNIKFEFNKRGGFFKRLVNTLSILEYPSSFSSFVLDYNKESKIFLRNQKTSLIINNNTSVLLNDLIEYDYEKDSHDIFMELNVHLIDFMKRHEATSDILKDTILIYLASYFARYEPQIWKNLYIGEKSDLIYHINTSFENINNMIRLVSNIISEAENNVIPSHFMSGNMW